MSLRQRLQAANLDSQRSALLVLSEIARGLHRGKPKPAHLVTGERGELEAMFYLRRMGYLIIERRWRTPDHNGDLDLVGWDGDRLCLIEVKTRTARDRTPAALAVDRAKQRELRRMGRSFLRTLGREERQTILPRFDVVSVYLLGDVVECELLREAFAWRETEAREYGV